MGRAGVAGELLLRHGAFLGKDAALVAIVGVTPHGGFGQHVAVVPPFDAGHELVAKVVGLAAARRGQRAVGLAPARVQEVAFRVPDVLVVEQDGVGGRDSLLQAW